MEKYKYLLLIVLIFIILIFSIGNISMIQYTNNIVEFTNEKVMFKLKERSIVLDETMFHIILFILFDFESFNEKIDLYFKNLKKNYFDEIKIIRKSFEDYIKTNCFNHTVNIKIETSMLKYYIEQMDYNKKREIINKVIKLCFTFIESLSDRNIQEYNIENVSNPDIKMILLFIFSNYNKIIKIIKNSDIYDKLIEYWNNFIINYELIELVNDFNSFYSLSEKKIKIKFYYYGKNSNGYYKNDKIVLENCFYDKIKTQSIFIHELAHFYDLSNSDFSKNSYSIDIRSVFKSVFLSDEIETEQINSKMIKVIIDFFINYIDYPGFLSEFIADLASMYFLYNNNQYYLLIQDNLKDLLLVEIVFDELSITKLFNDNVNNIKDIIINDLNIVYLNTKSNMYVELIDYFIKTFPYDIKTTLFSDQRIYRDNILKDHILYFINNKMIDLLLNNNWKFKKNFSVLIYEYLTQKY